MQISECSIRIQSTSHRCWLRRGETERNKLKTKDDGKNNGTNKSPEFFFLLNFARIFPKGTSRNQTLFFSLFFLYFSLNKDHKRCNHKNWHLQLRWYVVYRKSARSLKSVQKPCEIFFFMFPIFFGNFDETKQGVAEFGSAQLDSRSCCKNFRFF